MKAFLFLLLTSILISSAFAKTEVDFSKFEVKVTLKAKDYADPFSYKNEYKIGLNLRGTNNHSMGALIGSTSANIHAPFSNYIRIEKGGETTVTSMILLPTKSLDSIELRVAAVEADFSIPIPGPCCIIANDDDRVIYERFSLHGQTLSAVSDDGSTEVEVTITKLSEGLMDLSVLKEKQKNLFYEESGIRFFDSNMFNLFSLFLETI
jgi:hypothetical protein